MSKIGIYTDVHCCYTSSILPIHKKGSKYTTRLQMVVDTFRWMYDEFEKHEVDFIVNCGDLFDAVNVRSEEVSAMAEAMSYSRGINEFHILGNHEIYDNNRQFYTSALLSNYENIEIIDQPMRKDDLNISFLPYMSADAIPDALQGLDNRILFSHVDVRGYQINESHRLESGADPDILSSKFDIVINGHLHSPAVMKGNIYSVGATTSLSFSDNSDYAPSIHILDTDTLSITSIPNPYAIRFVKQAVSNIHQISAVLTKYAGIPVVYRFTLPGDLKHQAEQLLEGAANIIAYRLMCTSVVPDELPDDTVVERVAVNHVSDVVNQFDSFLDSGIPLKYDKNKYHTILSQMQEEKA